MQPMPKIIIRRAQPADLEVLLHLLHALFSIEEDFTFDPDRQRAGLTLLLTDERSILLVAEYKNRVIGMCSGQLMISTAEGGLSLLVEDVVVDKHRQGKGVGTALLRALQEWGTRKNIVRLQLLADQTNSDALNFYRKLQWRQTQLTCLCKRSSHRTQENKKEEKNA